MKGDFEQLIVWQKAKSVAVETYKILKYCREYSIRNQMIRAALSISSNIAEGVERQHKRDSAQFLSIAKGSAGELRSQLLLANELGLISKSSSRQLSTDCKEIGAMLQSLIDKRTTHEKQG